MAKRKQADGVAKRRPLDINAFSTQALLAEWWRRKTQELDRIELELQASPMTEALQVLHRISSAR